MNPKSTFVPKEFTNELTNLIEQNPQVEEVLCSNLLSQTCRNEGQKFLNYFYNPEELEKSKASLPNLDHLIDLSLNEDAIVNIPNGASNNIGQINRNASNILSAPGKRFKDLSIKDPQKRLFRSLRNFFQTKSAHNTMFAGHFVRILENYLEPYVSEFKPESMKFYQDDFTIQALISFMVNNIHLLPYRQFLIRFVTDFSQLFPDDSNYALEAILSQASRFIFALKDKKSQKANSSKLITPEDEVAMPLGDQPKSRKIPQLSETPHKEIKKAETFETSPSISQRRKSDTNISKQKESPRRKSDQTSKSKKKSDTIENDTSEYKRKKSDTIENDTSEYKRKKSDTTENDTSEYKRKKSDTIENESKKKKSDEGTKSDSKQKRKEVVPFPEMKNSTPTKDKTVGSDDDNKFTKNNSSPIFNDDLKVRNRESIFRTPQIKHRNSQFLAHPPKPLFDTPEPSKMKPKRQRSKIFANIEITNDDDENGSDQDVQPTVNVENNEYYDQISHYQPITIENKPILMPLYLNPSSKSISTFDQLSSEFKETNPLLQNKQLPPKIPNSPASSQSQMRVKPKSSFSGKKSENKKFEYVQSGNILDLLNDTEATPRSPSKISRSSNNFNKTRHASKRMSFTPSYIGSHEPHEKNIPIAKTKESKKPAYSKSKNSVKKESPSEDDIENEMDDDENNTQANYIYYYNNNPQANCSSLESSDQIRRSYIDIESFDKTMKEFVKYDGSIQIEENRAIQSAYFLITIIRTAVFDNLDFYQTIRKSDTLLKLLLICGTFSDDDSCLSSEIFYIIRQVIVGNSRDDDENDNSTDNEENNEDSEQTNNVTKKKTGWKVPDFVADFAEYFTFDPYNVTEKMISAFPVFWNYRSPKYDVYSDFCYNKVFNRHQHHATHQNYPELVLDYPQFEGQHYTKPPGKTPLEVMTPVFFTEPPLSDRFNRYFKDILWNLGKRRQKLAGKDITQSKYISEIIDIDLIYVEFMRNQFDLSLDDPKYQRLTVISAIEKMLEINPCSNYWQENKTVARAMINGHILKLTSWTMKFDFLVVGKNKELSHIAFTLPSPKAEWAANYPQTTFDIKNLISRFKNKMMNIDLGLTKSDSDDGIDPEIEDGLGDL